MARRRPKLKLTRADACAVLSRLGIERGGDSDVLPSSKVSDLLEVADRFKYRKPKNANGSRGRYFHNFLQRLCS